MNNKNIFDALRDIDMEWILDAAPTKRRSAVRAWVRWGAVAACLCLVITAILGVGLWLHSKAADSSNPVPQHIHVFGEWHTIKEATCTEEGKKARICACGEEEIRFVALLPHFAGEWVVEKEPTIKLPTPDDPNQREPGIKCQFCYHCGAKLEEELIPAVGSLGLAYAINLDGKTCTVAGIGNCVDTEIIVPQNFCGYRVTAIAKDAFRNCRDVVSITLPDSITTIGDYAFSYCLNLTKVTLPEGLTDIGEWAFSDSDISEITIPTTVKSIGGSAFHSCYKLKSIVLPEGLETIGSFTFYFCKSLESIVIPESVTSIEENAFDYCSALKEISLPSGLTSMGHSAFDNCSSLESIVLPGTLETIPTFAFYKCYKLARITISNGITAIESKAFYGTVITEITIPVSVQVIDSHAFSYCKFLTTIFYEGTSEQWEEIEKRIYWDYELNCDIVFLGDSKE